MNARQNFSSPVEVSAPSTSLTSPAFNLNSAHSDTSTFPNPNSNEDINSDKYRCIECKEWLDENVVSEIEKCLSAKSKHKRKIKYWGAKDCRKLIYFSTKDEKHN